MWPSLDTIIKHRFSDQLIHINQDHFKGFKNWIIIPGMGFASHDKWWGDFGKRKRPHEGIDLLHYKRYDGTKAIMKSGISIPCPTHGEIKNILPDFLGSSILIKHDICIDNHSLYSFLGHLLPKKTIKPGSPVKQGEIVARVQPFPEKKTGMKPHIHFSLAWIHKTYDTDKLDWKTLTLSNKIILTDPYPVI